MTTQRYTAENTNDGQGTVRKGAADDSLATRLIGPPDDGKQSTPGDDAAWSEPAADPASRADRDDVPPTEAGRKSRGRWLLVGVVVVVLAGGGAWWWTHRSSNSAARSPSVTTRTVQATAALGTITSSVTSSGTVTPKVQQAVNFEVSGTVTKVAVTLGQTVQKGQLLATVDTLELRSAVASAKAGLAQATAKKSTDTDADAAAAQLSADNAAIAVAEQKVTQANIDLAAAQLKAPVSGQIQQLNLVVGQYVSGSGSSASGLSGAGSGAAGGAGNGGSGSGSSSTASDSSAQFLIVNTRTWQVDATVTDSQVGLLKKGMQATVALSTSADSSTGGGFGSFGGAGGFGGVGGAGGFGGFAAGGVGGGALGGQGQGASGRDGSAPNGTAGSAPSGGSGTAGAAGSGAQRTSAIFAVVSSVGLLATTSGTTTTFPVVLDVTGTPKNLHDGTAVTVTIIYSQRSDALLIPALAVRQQDGQSVVDKVTNGSVSTVPVTVGATSGNQIEITKGLSEGDTVQETITAINRSGTSNSNGRSGFGGFRNGSGGTGAGGAGAGSVGAGGFGGRTRGNG
jgi:multidrug efflux pump subunit AcrA (membrane-fusion protein)